MIRMLLMALGAYTLYRMYVPLPASRPPELLADQRSNRASDTARMRGRAAL